MENEKNTDRLAKNLMSVITNALKEDLYGKEAVQDKPEMDENSLLDSIKQFLTQALPGKKDKEEEPPTQTTIHQVLTGAPAYSQAETLQEKPEIEKPEAIVSPAEEWDEMKHHQEQEREELHWRHEQERESMQYRHEQERKALEFKLEREGKWDEMKREVENKEREWKDEKPGRGRGHGREGRS